MKKAIITLLTLTSLFNLDLNAKETSKKNKKESSSENFSRIYNTTLSSQNKKDISLIVKTLGLGSLTKIISSKSSMKKAGDRIKPVHPLKFLSFVFSDETLKAGAHNIRRSNIPFVWSEFWGGLKNSLSDEFKKGNLTHAQVIDFSNTVGIDPQIIETSVKNQDWLGFFDLLLKHIPRNENADRYNI